MMRSALSVLGFAVLLGLALPVPAQDTARRSTRPNVLWISNEDMSPRLGAYGDTLARTPNLDELAKASIRYTNAFTTAPVCRTAPRRTISSASPSRFGTISAETPTGATGQIKISRSSPSSTSR